MKATTGHTATNPGKRITIVLTTGEVITGKFVSRRKNSAIIVKVGTTTIRIPRKFVHQFLVGKYVKEAK